MAGLTPSGFIPKRFQQILDEMLADLDGSIGPIDDDASELLSEYLNIPAKVAADLWEVVLTVYNMFDPNAAQGANLEKTIALNGLKKLTQTFSLGTEQFYGNEGTSLPAGRVVSVEETGDRYQTMVDATITAAAAMFVKLEIDTVADNTLYSLSVSLVTFEYTSGVGATLTEILEGLIAAINVSTDVQAQINSDDDTLLNVTAIDTTQQYSFVPSGNISIAEIGVSVSIIAEQAGQVPGAANTITVLSTPVNGVTRVNNAVSVVQGRAVETDEEVRLRRAKTIVTSTAATNPALNRVLGQVPGVVSVNVKGNRSDDTDSEGRPPHSFEAIVQGGTNADVGTAVAKTGADGINTYGNTNYVYIDEEGNAIPVRFSRPENLYVWVRVTVQEYYDPTILPANLTQVITDSVVTYGNSIGIGNDVIPQRFFCTLLTIPGIGQILVELAAQQVPSPPPSVGDYSDDIIDTNSRQLPTFAASQVTVILP